MYSVSCINTKIALKVEGQSNVTHFHSLLAFTVGRIPTKFHQFLISSFRDFVNTNTDTQMPAKTIPAHSMRTGNQFGHYYSRHKIYYVYFGNLQLP